jgi:hypothetical protein
MVESDREKLFLAVDSAHGANGDGKEIEVLRGNGGELRWLCGYASAKRSDQEVSGGVTGQELRIIAHKLGVELAQVFRRETRLCVREF